MSIRRPPTDEQHDQIRRWLLIFFASHDREGKISSRIAEIEALVRLQHNDEGENEIEILAKDTARLEEIRLLKIEDVRNTTMLDLPLQEVLATARDNMKEFDHTSSAAPVPLSLLSSIDAELISLSDVEGYLPRFSKKALFAQSAILYKLIVESSAHPEVYEFTGALLDLLRRSSDYEPRVHAPFQQKYRRVVNPGKGRGRRRTRGNALFLSLVEVVSERFSVPIGSAAKIVQGAMSDVLVRVPDPADARRTKRHPFRLSDAAVKSLLSSVG